MLQKSPLVTSNDGLHFKDFHAFRSISIVKFISSLPFCIATCGILPSLRILKLPISINHVNSKFIRIKLDFQFASSIHQEK